MFQPLHIVVLISGSGSNLQAIMDDTKNHQHIEITAVISNNPTAQGLERAEQAKINTSVLDHHHYTDRKHYDQDLIQLIEQFKPDLLVLAGFMRILTPEFVHFYQGRMLNIHPSLLPKYTGLNTHQRVLDNKETLHGASVHFVTEELDGGPVILQASLETKDSDNATNLAQRVLQLEHVIYPTVIHWFAQKRLSLGKQGIQFDQQQLTSPLQWEQLKTSWIS